MPQFFYKAKTGPKDITTGYIEADTLANAVAKLTRIGHTPLDVKPVSARLGQLGAKDAQLKVPPTALLNFTRQTADLLVAGIPLLRCMELCSRQKKFPVMLTITEFIRLSLEQGSSMSNALSKYPGVFPPLYVNAVKAAEASAHLPLVFGRLAYFLEQDLATQARVRESLLYPFIILCVGVLTIFVLLSFVMPQLTVMFEDFDASLPLATRMVIGLSDVFARFWWLILGLTSMGVLWMKRFLSTIQGKEWQDTLALRVPILKSFIENVQLSRFARTLGMLLESGVPVAVALELVVAVVDNALLQKEVQAIAVKVKGGMSLGAAVKSSLVFPEIALDLITVGQESGKLENGLYQLAAGCERDSHALAQTFVTVLGPAVLVLVVGIVGSMIVAMLLPMFQINEIIR